MWSLTSCVCKQTIFKIRWWNNPASQFHWKGKWSCSTVSNSLWPHGLHVAYQAPPSMGFSRQGHWSRWPFPSPGDLPNTGIKPWSPTLQADALPSEPPKKFHWNLIKVNRDSLRILKSSSNFQGILKPNSYLSAWSEVKSLSRVQLFATPWTVAYQAPPSMGFSRQ